MSSFDQDMSAVFVGAAPGPSVLIIGGMHGNEKTGIAVVQQLQDKLSSGAKVIASGTLTLVLGNPQAIVQNVRAINGRDLNRYFSDDALAHNDGSDEFRRAAWIAEKIRSADVTIDIHATNKPSVPFVASKNDPAHRDVFRWLKPQNVLIDPYYLFGNGVPVTTDEYADSQGRVGLCFETGWVGDESVVPRVIESLLEYLVYSGVVKGKKQPMPEFYGTSYEIVEAVLLDEYEFLFSDGRGEASFESINENDIIGYRGDEPVVAKHTGVIMFPKLPEHRAVGKPVCYIAKRIA